MEKMKKVLSAALSAVLLACSVVCGISASAAGTPTKATPLTGWTQSGNFYQYRTLTEVQPLGFTTAVGRKISASSTAIDPVDFGNISSSQAYFGMNYSADNYYSIADTTGILLYVKTDGANDIMPIFELLKDGVSYNVSFLLSVGKEYQYAALNSDKWETGTVKAGGKTDSTFWGTFGFDGAFEGYVKIPYSSLANDGGKKIDTASDQLAVFGFKLRGLGGDFGSTVIGPVMLITADSTSTKIEVPQEYQPAPIAATPITGWTVNRNAWQTVKSTEVYPVDNILAQGIQMSPSASLSGGSNVVEDNAISTSQNYTAFNMNEELSLSGTTGMIFYVKTDGANKIMPDIVINNTGVSWVTWNPDMALGVGKTYEYRALDADTWTAATATAGHTNDYNGVVSFDSAFEGFVKIPYTSLTNDSVSSIKTELNTAVRFLFKVKGIGDTYGNTVVGPVMLITSDSTSTKIEVPDEFKPAPIEVKSVVDFKTVRSGAYVFTANPVENGYSLSIDPSILSEEEIKYTAGASKWSYVEAEDGKIGSNGMTVMIMDPTIPLAPCGSEGFLVYLKTDSANALAISFEYERGTHWSPNYDPQMMLKPGTTVNVCPTGSETWVDKTVEIGHGTNTDMYGMITFDAAFEGYIKVPYSALNNDSGWKPYTTVDKGSIDRIKRITFRFKGIGGKVENGLYGNVTVGLTGYITADSPSVSYNVSAPVYNQGDVNNDWFVNAGDLTQLKKYLLGADAEINVVDANVDKDIEGQVNIIDLIRLKKLIAD